MHSQDSSQHVLFAERAATAEQVARRRAMRRSRMWVCAAVPTAMLWMGGLGSLAALAMLRRAQLAADGAELPAPSAAVERIAHAGLGVYLPVISALRATWR